MQNATNRPFYLLLLGGAVAALVAAALGVGYSLRHLSPVQGNGDCYEQEAPPGEQGPQDYTKWPKPVVALVLSGQMHGYYDPCGCSIPQYGGLTRRFNFIQSLKKKGWDVVGIDLGELPSLKGIHEQNLLKFDMCVKALGTMNYRAFGIGADEILLPLGPGLTQIWDEKKPFPRPLSLSLAQTAPGQMYYGLNVRPYEIIDDTNPKIGVVSMMGPDLREKFKEQEKFGENKKELSNALKKFAEAGVEVGIILHHEYPNVDTDKFPIGFKRDMEIEKQRTKRALDCARFCADARAKNQKIPPIQIMMLLTHEPLAPSFIRELDPQLKTQIVEIGHKGKYVGLLGVYRAAKGFRLRYQIVLMEPAFDTKKGAEKDNLVTGLMENYNRELKRQNMLGKFPRTPHFNQLQLQGGGGLKATYVGSERCIDCHAHAGAVWQNSLPVKAHFKATATLENLKHPSGRQYDPECMMCHTTGFKHPGGYNDLVTNLATWPMKPKIAPNPKKVKAHNEVLRGVGCESCHGPGSAHVKNPDNKALYESINPYAPSAKERKLEAVKNRNAAQEKQWKGLFDKRMDRMAQNLCIKCHDPENDAHWGQPGQDTADKWKTLIHRKASDPAPAKGNNPAPAVGQPPIVIEVVPDEKK